MLGQYHFFAKLAHFDFSSSKIYCAGSDPEHRLGDALRYVVPNVLVLCKGLSKGRSDEGECLCKGPTKGFVSVASAAAADVSVPLAFRAPGGKSFARAGAGAGDLLL
jgi:hypothetical protein